jgi:hypothetical protein
VGVRIDPRSSTPPSKSAEKPLTFELNEKRSITIGGQKIEVIPNGATRRQPRSPNTPPPRDEKERWLALLSDVKHELHPAISGKSKELRPGHLANDYYTIKLEPELKNGYYDFKLNYSERGQKVIDAYRSNRRAHIQNEE